MNWSMFVLAILAFIHQNNYFGWNAKPQSDAEIVADLITILIFALSFMGSKQS